jgi:hypothetical protein
MANEFDFASLGNMFGGGGLPSGLDALLSEDQRKLLGRNAALSAAGALLQASGRSAVPISMGQALGSALQAGQQGYQQARASSFQDLLLGEKLKEAQRLGQYQTALTGAPQKAESVQPMEPLTAAQASLLSQTAPISAAGPFGPSPQRAQLMDQIQAQPTIAPEPLTATEKRYNELMRKADVANQFGKFDDADKLIGQALKIKPPEKYATTPQYGNSKQGTPISFVLSESGGMKLLDVQRSPEFNYQDTGSYISVRDKNSNKELERIPKTMTPGEVASNIVAQGNLAVNRANLGVAQGGLALRQQEFNRGGFQLKEGPDGLSYVPTAPGGPTIPVMTAAGTPFEGAGAKPTEDQSKSAGFAFRMKQSSQIFNQPALNRSGEPIIDPKTGNPVTLEQAFGQPGKYQSIMRSIPSAGLTTGLANLSESTGSQQYRQAQQNWVTANLRPESGAVIGADEMDKEIIKYFPQTSDSQKTIEQKARARRDTELAMTVRAGPAYKQMEKAVAAQNAALAAPAPMAQPGAAVPTVRQPTGNARLVRDPVTGIFNYVME